MKLFMCYPFWFELSIGNLCRLCWLFSHWYDKIPKKETYRKKACFVSQFEGTICLWREGMTTSVSYLVTWHPQSGRQQKWGIWSYGVHRWERERDGRMLVRTFLFSPRLQPMAWCHPNFSSVLSSCLAISHTYAHTEIFISMVNLTPIILTIKISDCHFQQLM